ncbi:hypothetical protein GLAREA_09196 [Glarea lozoyensis ATCC 20868]|uniref:Endoplasmic reticulum junction formation protein lunapark n=1 Tax=Glarea lozoyensis (strain ATCC 20868 / MF5171) TaxID=1116229 RepID=S3EFR8_GLAL2|nr:uncharacterized protein GLAREA_09196 [Glarea lozoyensis ATCC 20868]EPE37033.1 hypothetical protein GLAREA_09196 [Glarea lozoyensis ATCC 20868]
MVKLWPWKGEDNSAASFEKALSSLAAKINKSQTQLDVLRQKGRRLKALWTLYAIFAYLLCTAILILVVGWSRWTAVEYTSVSAAPLCIYLVRKGISGYYNYRIDLVSQRLEGQQSERTKTIDKLKAATKYNSTQELLEKYGGTTPTPKPKKLKAQSKSPKDIPPQRTVTGPPPPTANIPQRSPDRVSKAPYVSTSEVSPSVGPPNNVRPAPTSPSIGSAEFAPNAFSGPMQYASSTGESSIGGHWYDRVLDLLMGEDETSARNRIVLICQNCRLVNGQAPPGIRSATELGRWRCSGCGAWNGEEDEAVKVVQEMKEKIEQQPRHSGSESDEDALSDSHGVPGSEVQKGLDIGSIENVAHVKHKKNGSKDLRKA